MVLWRSDSQAYDEIHNTVTLTVNLIQLDTLIRGNTLNKCNCIFVYYIYTGNMQEFS